MQDDLAEEAVGPSTAEAMPSACGDQAAGPAPQEENAFAYLDRQDFTSEKFKIEIKNMPKFYGIQELRKLINHTLGLNSSKLKVPSKNSRFCFVCFHNDEEREKALVVIKATKWKGSQLTATKAKPTEDPLVKKRKSEEDNSLRKKGRAALSIGEQLKAQTTPLWDVPYIEQLAQKQEAIRTILRNLGKELYRNPELSHWVQQQQQKYDGLPCELLDARYVDQIDEYRNKCEFSVGMYPKTTQKTVGFRIGSYAEGSTGVAPVDELRHVPAVMKRAVKLFENYVRSSSLAVFDPVKQCGHFKQLTARSAKNQLMLIVGIVPTNMEPAEIDAFQADVVKYFFEGDGKAAGVTSLYYQALLKKKFNDDRSSQPVHLHGEKCIVETMHGLKFHISAEAFFQVNTPCAELMYETVIELAGIQRTSTVVDVCCGTGTIGLCCAHRCDQVLGLDMFDDAVRDAGTNAALNNIRNAEFFCGKAEEILHSVVARARNDDVVAILDPPRVGLQRNAVLTLRKVDRIQKMVLIACNPKRASDSIVYLARPASKTIQGVPFVPVKAVMFDLFPHTHHSELVVLLERLDQAQPSTSES